MFPFTPQAVKSLKTLKCPTAKYAENAKGSLALNLAECPNTFTIVFEFKFS